MSGVRFQGRRTRKQKPLDSMLSALCPKPASMKCELIAMIKLFSLFLGDESLVGEDVEGMRYEQLEGGFGYRKDGAQSG